MTIKDAATITHLWPSDLIIKFLLAGSFEKKLEELKTIEASKGFEIRLVSEVAGEILCAAKVPAALLEILAEHNIQILEYTKEFTENKYLVEIESNALQR